MAATRRRLISVPAGPESGLSLLRLGSSIGPAGRRVPVARLAWLWFVVAFVLYSLATRTLLNYLLPAAAPRIRPPPKASLTAAPTFS